MCWYHCLVGPTLELALPCVCTFVSCRAKAGGCTSKQTRAMYYVCYSGCQMDLVHHYWHPTWDFLLLLRILVLCSLVLSTENHLQYVSERHYFWMSWSCAKSCSLLPSCQRNNVAGVESTEGTIQPFKVPSFQACIGVPCKLDTLFCAHACCDIRCNHLCMHDILHAANQEGTWFLLPHRHS